MRWTNRKRKEGRAFYLTLTASVIWQLWQSKAFHHATPYQGQSSLLPSHTPYCRAHTHQLYLTPPSLPPCVSLYRIILPPPPQIPSLNKEIFLRAWIAGVTCCALAQKPKTLHTCRWDEMHTNTPKLLRHEDADNSICLSHIITPHPPPFLLSLHPYLLQLGSTLVFVSVENSRIIDNPGIVVVVCSPYPCRLMWITPRSDERERQGLQWVMWASLSRAKRITWSSCGADKKELSRH